MTATAYRLLGTTDDHTDCCLCGRTDLKSTVALEVVETGETVYYGSECAAKALGWQEREVKAAARTADREAHEARMAVRQQKARDEHQSWQAFLTSRTGLVEVAEAIQALGGFTEAHRLYTEAQA